MNNSNIKKVTHQPKPVSIERELGDVVVIEGVRYSGDLFREFTLPSQDALYAVRRDGDTVSLTVIRNAEEAKQFFEEIGQGGAALVAEYSDVQEQGDEDVV